MKPTPAGDSFLLGRMGIFVETPTRQQAVRAFYRQHIDNIMLRSDEWGIDAYAWDTPKSGIFLSPIEQYVWGDIRQANCVFYPQWPIEGFFVDFGNPVAKVCIECDGQRWHLDMASDAARQKQIEALGWTVYRLTGWQCAKDDEEYEDDEGRILVERSPAAKLMAEIARRFNVKRT